MNLNTPFNREQESMNIFRDYINFCHAEQSSLNNILHTQNTLANNRYSMFSLMFRHIHNDSISPTIPPTTWPPHNPFNNNNNIFTRNRFFNTNNNITRWPNNRHNRFNSTNTTLNPLQEFISAAARNNNERRRPATMRQFFENCEVFLYSQDISYNQIRCPIAMTDFSNNDICVRLPCNHIFKIQPILQWFTRSRSCPLCRRRINANNNNDNENNTNNTIDLSTENASVQTRDISNGFVADISANSMENLTRALTNTLQNRLQSMFNDPNLPNTPTLVTTNISLIGDRIDHISSAIPPQTSPINNTNTDNSGNIV